MIGMKTSGKKNAYGQIQIGTSSLVLIFTVLCLVVFSTLSLASAKADGKLAERNEASVMDYYAADGKAEQKLKQVDETTLKLAMQAEDGEAFRNLLGETFHDAYDKTQNRINYTVEVNEEQIIFVNLQLIDYESIKEGQKSYKVISWIVQNKVDYEVDDSMPVWDGEAV